jgi:hypothetical protein
MDCAHKYDSIYKIMELSDKLRNMGINIQIVIALEISPNMITPILNVTRKYRELLLEFMSTYCIGIEYKTMVKNALKIRQVAYENNASNVITNQPDENIEKFIKSVEALSQKFASMEKSLTELQGLLNVGNRFKTYEARDFNTPDMKVPGICFDNEIPLNEQFIKLEGNLIGFSMALDYMNSAYNTCDAEMNKHFPISLNVKYYPFRPCIIT